MADRSHREVCKDAVPKLPSGQGYEVPQPLRYRTWSDEDGVTWRRRGQETLTPKQARKLLARAAVQVVHVYDGAAHEHVGPDRDGLVAEVEQYWHGNADPMATFDLGEFRDDAHHVLVLIVEQC